MTIGTEGAVDLAPPRVPLDSSKFRLPSSGQARPGDHILLYQDRVQLLGWLKGHSGDGRPIVLSERDIPVDVASFDCLRVSGGRPAVGPTWERLPEGAGVWRPTAQERQAFIDILTAPFPPGPAPLELINELYYRGYETFLVGGTVRDVIAGRRPRSIHIVTTYPLPRAQHLLRAMYGPANIPDPLPMKARLSGQIEVTANAERTVEFTNFKLDQTGTEGAKFGDSLEIDASHRDFCCNAVYYDPINDALFDPTGRGVKDAERSCLHLARRQLGAPADQAKLFIRSFAFLARGFTFDPDEGTLVSLNAMGPSLASLAESVRFEYVEMQVMAHPLGSPKEKFDLFRQSMVDLGFAQVFADYFEAGAEIICRGHRER